MYLNILIVCIFIAYIKCDDCGPSGYNARDLLRQNYWYFDLESGQCPTFPEDHNYPIYPIPGNSTDDHTQACRIYFNLCKSQTYQCSGAVCARYKNSFDLVTLLGKYESESHPFHEGQNTFRADYTGEKLQCGKGVMPVKTSFNFYCNESAQWNYTNSNFHGGSVVPTGLLHNVTFNNNTCQFTVNFLSAEACPYYPNNDSQTKKLSYGSLILILFFPGLMLYFIIGSLFNRMRGFEGKDMIPHRTFWIDLPELIMDGFLFTMATLTCKHEDRFSKEYDAVA